MIFLILLENLLLLGDELIVDLDEFDDIVNMS